MCVTAFRDTFPPPHVCGGVFWYGRHFWLCPRNGGHTYPYALAFLVAVVSKYPPAEPEALRLLAPQRGLIATAEKQKQLQRHEAREATGFGKTKATAGGILPEFSKFDCLPGRAGGTPISLGCVVLVHT